MDEAVDSVIGQLLRPSAFKVHEPIQPIKVGDADARSTASVIVAKGEGSAQLAETGLAARTGFERPGSHSSFSHC